MLFEIEQRFRSLEQLVNLAGEKGLEERLASYLSKFGCVLVCGNLERCVEIVVTARVSSRSPPQVGSFLKSYFKRGTGYDCDQISQLLYRFDTSWGKDFESFIVSNYSIRESISSCYAVRNSIAHGGGQSLGPRVLKQYYNASFELVTHLEYILR